ncbi:cupin-like domain-containing protein [Sporobolomyces salmoneus]|uniref:cupin-like domain-containing protein n=1 Tax=Sporobolomyces salmoneus TaxID=183962 RepID=UPI003177DEA6
MSFSPLEKELRRHVRSYQEYNSSTCTELSSTPSPLEFHRFVAANRPVVIRRQGYRDRVAALKNWTDRYLVETMEDRQVNISVDPTGNADSIVDGYFVEPANVKMSISALLSKLREEDVVEEEAKGKPVHYLQSQNGNLSSTGEYAPLLPDVGPEGPSWAREAFGQSPDVANVWIGGNKSKTSIHKDPYENIYLVVRGSKEFILYPPSEAYCMHEQTYPHASWSYDPTSATPFTLTPTQPRLSLPWIPINPLLPPSAISESYPRHSLARPMRVRLEKGDVLYLPAFWYHHVSQTTDHYRSEPDEEDMEQKGVRATIAVNWWFDVKFEGPFWTGLELNRRLVKRLDREQRNGDDAEEDSSSENDDDAEV